MRLVGLLLTGWMCGCAAGDAATHAVVRDSAGVRIVENDLTAELPRYVIGEDALVEIGAVEGAEPYLLDNVRRARWLDDGAIAVLNGGTNEVRVFDAAGAFVRGYGRQGQGPGEYQWPLDVWQKGDSLVVYDWTLPAGRITFTALAERGVRTIRTIGPQALRTTSRCSSARPASSCRCNSAVPRRSTNGPTSPSTMCAFRSMEPLPTRSFASLAAVKE